MNDSAEKTVGAALPAPPRSGTKHIAALLQCTNLGGMENVSYSLFEQLQARGFTLKVVTPRPWGPGRPRVLNIDPEAQAFNYQGKFGWRSFPTFRRHAKAVCRFSERVWVIGTDVSCLAAARLTGKKILLSHHYHHFENRWSRLRWTAFYLAFGFGLDAITYPTEFTRNEAFRIAPWLKGKTHIVRYGFDLHYETEEQVEELKRAARSALGLPQDAFVVGNGGWLIPRKRFDVFLHTAKWVSQRIPNARFYICGGGPEEGCLRKLAEDLGIAEQVHFTGWVQDLTSYYRAWDALLFNSDFDTLPCTPLEAASYGCLCVASCRYGGLSEFIKDGKTGFLLTQHDPEKLAEILVCLFRSPTLGSAIRQEASQSIDREFSNRTVVRFYENYFANGGS